MSADGSSTKLGSVDSEIETAMRMLVAEMAPGDLHDDYDGNVVLAARAAVEEFHERGEKIENLQTEIDRLEAKQKADENTRGSKKMKAKRYSVNKLIAISESNTRAGLNGGGVTAREVLDAAEGTGTSFTHSTINSAWEALADEWGPLRIKPGDRGPHGESKKLIADELPDGLVQAYGGE